MDPINWIQNPLIEIVLILGITPSLSFPSPRPLMICIHLYFPLETPHATGLPENTSCLGHGAPCAMKFPLRQEWDALVSWQ